MSHRYEVFSETTDGETAGRVSHGAATTWTRTQMTWRINNRWTIAIAGVFLQIALGAVYA
jgi:cobalamin biosynthesis protein CobD/CbiB